MTLYHNFSNYALKLGAGTAAAPSLIFGDAATGGYRSAENEIGFAINGTQRFNFNATGLQVTGASLQVTNSGAAASFRIYTYRESAIQSSVTCCCARGTSAAPACLQSGDGIGSLQALAWTTGTTFVVSGQFRIVATENHSNTAIGCKAQIWTTPNGSTSQAVALELGNDKAMIAYGSAKITTGFAAWNTTPPASKPEITGDLSAYNETAFKAVITALAACGLMTDSTTT